MSAEIIGFERSGEDSVNAQGSEFSGQKFERSTKDGGNGGGSGMEARIAKLEAHVERAQTDIADIGSDVKSINKGISEISSDIKLISAELKHKPTYWGTALIMIALLGLLVTLIRFDVLFPNTEGTAGTATGSLVDK